MDEKSKGIRARIERKFQKSNGGQRLGMGCGLVALFIAVLTTGGLMLAAAFEGGCGEQCVNRGWYGVFAAGIVIPLAIGGLIVYAIGSAVKKD